MVEVQHGRTPEQGAAQQAVAEAKVADEDPQLRHGRPTRSKPPRPPAATVLAREVGHGDDGEPDQDEQTRHAAQPPAQVPVEAVARPVEPPSLQPNAKRTLHHVCASPVGKAHRPGATAGSRVKKSGGALCPPTATPPPTLWGLARTSCESPLGARRSGTVGRRSIRA